MKTLKLEFPETLLPDVDKKSGSSLMEALSKRSSARNFSDKSLEISTVSELLWAAAGVNRPDGRRTAPTAVNWQEIDIYAVTREGVYIYNASKHSLVGVEKNDIREFAGKQAFTSVAPITLVFVSNYDKITGRHGDDETKKAFYSATDTGYISQNVYLYCASKGLITVALGLVDRETLHKKLNLNQNQHIILSQTVGYPEK
ncbi:MAG: SagB/ThcOx family dehydrogenase [Deltaproteobacteria bacterium]|nr:SagB/ThcOx family dehydrogenase [Deltaproteobacteria bacterium]